MITVTHDSMASHDASERRINRVVESLDATFNYRSIADVAYVEARLLPVSSMLAHTSDDAAITLAGVRRWLAIVEQELFARAEIFYNLKNR